MQKGRGWRRAIPRITLFDNGYAGQMPYKLTPRGTFQNGIFTVAIPDTWSIQHPFRDTSPQFVWIASWTTLGELYTYEVIAQPTEIFPGGIWTVELRIEGLIGSLKATWLVPPGLAYISTGATYFATIPPDLYESTPPFGTANDLLLAGWQYSDGPY